MVGNEAWIATINITDSWWFLQDFCYWRKKWESICIHCHWYSIDSTNRRVWFQGCIHRNLIVQSGCKQINVGGTLYFSSGWKYFDVQLPLNIVMLQAILSTSHNNLKCRLRISDNMDLVKWWKYEGPMLNNLAKSRTRSRVTEFKSQILTMLWWNQYRHMYICSQARPCNRMVLS